MKLALAAAGTLLTLTACSSDIPLLHPDLKPAQILALPAKAGLSSARYQATFTGPDGTLYNASKGVVQARPVRALTQVTTATAGGFGGQSEYREVDGVGYYQVLPGWSHPRWATSNAGKGGVASGNPIYFDTWSALGPMVVEGQEGSALDRAWRLRAPNPQFGPGATMRVWIRQRDGYPLKYQVDFAKGRQVIVFDQFNSAGKVTAPPAKDLSPPPPGAGDAGTSSWTGGSLRVLAVDYSYAGSLAAAEPGKHVVGVETYLDLPNQPLFSDTARWELLGADGTAYPAYPNAPAIANGKGAGGDQVTFFAVPNAAQPPFSLHFVLTDYPGKGDPGLPPSPPPVRVDAVVRLA